MRAPRVNDVPGIALWREGRRAEGSIILLWMLASLAILGVHARSVMDGLVSLGITLFLLATHFSARSTFIPDGIAQHWWASIAAVALPFIVVQFSRVRTRIARSITAHGPASEWSMVRRQFSRNGIAVAGLIAVVLLYLVALLAPLLAPRHPNAFQDGIVTQYKPPLSRILTLHVREARVRPLIARLPDFDSTGRRLVRIVREINARLTDEGVSRIYYVDRFEIKGDAVRAIQGDNETLIPLRDMTSSNPAEFADHSLFLLGTDSYGRDVLSRIIYGTRVSLSLGLIAVLLSVLVGTAVGIVAGYFGRIVDSILMRTVDVLLALPLLFLILGVIALFDASTVPRFLLIVLVLGLTTWMGIARLVRGEVLSLREREFVLAAHALGISHARIVTRHILPNVLTPVIVNATLRIGGIILVEAALSFLNLGVQQPTASWGSIILEGKDVLTSAWWISTFPGLVIVFTVVCFNLVGDGLRDAIDPTLKDE